MSEAELMAEYALRVDRVWDITQWWASVTFAVLVAVHIGSDSLNKLIVGIVLLLYTLFTVLAAQIIFVNGEAQMTTNLALQAMESELSLVGKRQISSYGAMIIPTMLATWGLTYLSTVFYIIYCYRRGATSGGT